MKQPCGRVWHPIIINAHQVDVDMFVLWVPSTLCSSKMKSGPQLASIAPSQQK
jgi:hypothetical protein